MYDGQCVVIIRKCRCNQVWCAECSKYQLKIAKIRLQQFDWKKSRMITTTVSREYGNQEEIYKLTRDKPRYLIKDIQRVKRKKINRYICFLEWQEGGYSHYHIIIETNKIGMIGKHEIQALWKYGNCWEDYFHDYQHWINVTGYFEKHSYFDMSHEKGHQVQPPEFLLKGKYDAKRITYSRNDDWLLKKAVGIFTGSQSIRTINKKTLQERIETCGKKIIVDIIIENKMIKGLVVNTSYEEIKNIEGLEYKEKIGLIGKIQLKELTKMINKSKIKENTEQEIIEKVWKGFINAIRTY